MCQRLLVISVLRIGFGGLADDRHIAGHRLAGRLVHVLRRVPVLLAHRHPGREETVAGVLLPVSAGRYEEARGGLPAPHVPLAVNPVEVVFRGVVVRGFLGGLAGSQHLAGAGVGPILLRHQFRQHLVGLRIDRIREDRRLQTLYGLLLPAEDEVRLGLDDVEQGDVGYRVLPRIASEGGDVLIRLLPLVLQGVAFGGDQGGARILRSLLGDQFLHGRLPVVGPFGCDLPDEFGKNYRVHLAVAAENLLHGRGQRFEPVLGRIDLLNGLPFLSLQFASEDRPSIHGGAYALHNLIYATSRARGGI